MTTSSGNMVGSATMNYPLQHYITSRNLLYSYIDASPNDEPTKYTALLLHGHGDFSYGWRLVVPELVKRRIRCIVPDLLGFGNSSKPVDVGAYRLKAMADDMIEVLANAKVVDQQVVVIGHDWGSQLASRLILHHPNNFKACVSLSAPYLPPIPVRLTLDQFIALRPNFSYWKFFTSEECPTLIRGNLLAFLNFIIRTKDEEVLPMNSLETVLRATPQTSATPSCPQLWNQDALDIYVETYARGGWEGPMNWYKSFLLNFEDEQPFIHDPSISHPFLVLLGSKDPAVPPESGEEHQHLLPRGTVSVIDSGHWMPQERSSEVVDAVLLWLDELARFPE